MPLNLLILIQPSPGKTQRCREVLDWLTPHVQSHEPDVTVYRIRETSDYAPSEGEGERTFFVHMEIKDGQALEARKELPHHRELAKILKEEKLVRQLKYMRMSGAGGFMR